MAGFLGFGNYSKPGPGVEVYDDRPGIIIFFDIYFRKFWNLIKMNLLLFLFSIPTIVLYMLGSLIVLPQFFKGEVGLDFAFKMIIGALFMAVPVIACGPAQAGFTYVMRNYARQEHAFLWSDFKENAVKNFRQSLIISGIDFLVFFLTITAFWVYTTLAKGNFIILFPATLSLIALVIFMIMHMYMYPMLVTFEFKVKDIYKNAFIFAIMRFIPNLLVLIVCVAIVLLTFLGVVLGFILLPLITLSTIALITNYFVYPTLKKYIMDAGESMEAGEDGEGQQEQVEETTEEDQQKYLM